ncbi:MAG TPA: sulfur carrier protein ThiS [Chthoniobacterales bacterium]|jgi:thiamine biosynthesis protein ThiS|nr:sulfur carrier protein ThiS [Chthoniobacterales bacterium]
MKIFVNGEAEDLEKKITVAELVQRHRLAPESTLLELNGVALHRREWERAMLGESDRVEILRVAAGG